MTERFEIDIEGTTQENALFQGDEFLCYADDVEAIIEKLNELNDENEHLIRKRGELETKNIILKGENEELKQKIKELEDMNQMMRDTILLCKETIKEDLTYREMQDNLEMILWNVVTDD